ncbi:MAG TPA: hypothetical protein DC047_08460 [Blastocatellia bacterium]|nr:hypothetical protein [Blastocatellia bacterium]
MAERAQTQVKPTALPVLPAGGSSLQRKCACGTHTLGDHCDSCKGGAGLLQRKAAGGGGYSDVPPIVHDVLRSPGQPLDTATRAFFEPRFGHDFSRVRVHTDARAAESARAVNAVAYNVADQIVFAPGKFQPHTTAGRKLLAHEMAHVVQQHGPNHTPVGISQRDDSWELEADRAVDSIMSGQNRPVILGSRPSAPQLHRQVEADEKDPCASEVHSELDPETEPTDDEDRQSKTDPEDEADDEKEGPAKRRRWIRKAGNFVGKAIDQLLGRTTPRYFQRPRRRSGKKKPKYGYETTKTQKFVKVTKSDSSTERIQSEKFYHGGQPLSKGDSKTRMFPFRNTGYAGLFTDPEPATTPKGGRFIAKTTTTKVTASLTFSLGVGADTDVFGGKGRIKVTAIDLAGKVTDVYDTMWITTQGKPVTVVLPNPPCNVTYVVEVGAEDWGSGHTEYEYDLQLNQQMTTVTEFKVDIITKKKVKK